MKLRHLIAVSTAALAVGLASPALGQNTNTNTNNTQNNSTSSSSGTGAAAASASATSNGVTYDLDITYDNSVTYDLDASVTYDLDTSVSYDLDASVSYDLDASVNNEAEEKSIAVQGGGEVDTVANGDGSIAASRGGEVEIGNAEDSNNTEDSFNSGNIVAEQELTAIISNDGGMEAVVDDTNQGYQSGDNSVDSNAFAAFAGILNQAWNTGVNANTQAATNIAAGATINFGDAAGSGNCPGNSCH